MRVTQFALSLIESASRQTYESALWKALVLSWLDRFYAVIG